MNHHLLHLWFSYYWCITAVALILVLVGVLIWRPNTLWTIAPTIAGLGLGLIYFVQKQNLEELLLFEKLFTQFNKRYGKLNDTLQQILADDKLADVQVRKAPNDYFNLCAEEYLFFSEGRILTRVWKAWCRGMREYLKNDRVRQYWEQEEGAGSYYGLTRAVIEKWAV
jgi:hypothetical protein